MEKIFDGKKITIRELKPGDIKNVRKFQDFINSLVKENAKVKVNKRVSLKEETAWLKSHLKAQQKKKKVFLLAEDKRILAGITQVSLDFGRNEHVGTLGISVRAGYRRIGLGKYLMKEIIELAKKS